MPEKETKQSVTTYQDSSGLKKKGIKVRDHTSQ